MPIRRWLLVLGALLAGPSASLASEPVVAVTTIIEHPALGATRRGLEAGLRDAGLVPGETLVLVHRSAGGSRAKAERIARDFAALRPDVVVPISTPSAQAVVAFVKDVPVVFAAVTDPLAAKLVDDLDAPGGNVVGVSDGLPVDDHLDLISEVLPAARLVGVLYDPEEANARSAVDALARAASGRVLEVVSRPVRDPGEVRHAADALASEVDAFYVPPDNTVVGILEDLIEVGVEHRIPVFGSDIHTVPRGVLAALGFNYFEVGRQAAALVVRIIAGETPGEIPIQTVRGTDLYINLETAERLDLRLPEDVVKRARVAIATDPASGVAGRLAPAD